MRKTCPFPSYSFHPPCHSLHAPFFLFSRVILNSHFAVPFTMYTVTAELTFENAYQDDRRTTRAHLRHVFPARHSLHASSCSRGACEWANVLSVHHQHHHWRSTRESCWLCTLQPPKGTISKKSARYALYRIYSIDPIYCINLPLSINTSAGATPAKVNRSPCSRQQAANFWIVRSLLYKLTA